MTGACHTPQRTLDQAAAALRASHAVEARTIYGKLVDHRDPRIRVQAYLGSARACGLTSDDLGERRWLELAIEDVEVPGFSEEVYFELAELMQREGDRSRAVNYYYRAAASAERDRRPEIYQRAIQAIQTLGILP